MINNERLAVILGAGPVGQTVADELLGRAVQRNENIRIRIVNRSGMRGAPAPIEAMAGDISDLDFARQVGADADVVFNCLNPAYHQWPEWWPRLHAGVMATAAENRARLVVMSNLYVYGDPQGQLISESLPRAARTKKGRVREAIDADAMAAHVAGRFPVTILRASDFFGPRVRMAIMGAPVFDRIVAGQSPVFIGNPDVPHTYSYVPDVARALVLLSESESAFGREWHVPSPPTVLTRDFLRIACEAVEQPAKVTVVPGWLLAMIGWLVPMLREMREMQYQFQQPFVMDDRAFRAAFPDFAPTPLETAIAATVEWFRAHPTTT